MCLTDGLSPPRVSSTREGSSIMYAAILKAGELSRHQETHCTPPSPGPFSVPRGGMQLSVDLTCVDHKSELDSVVCEVKQFSPSYFFSQHHRGPIYDRPKAAAKGMSKYVSGTPNLNFRTVGILQFSTDFRDAKTTGRKSSAGQCGSRWSWEYEARKWHLSWSTTNFLEMWHIGLKAAGYCKSEKVWVCKLD